MKGNRPKQQPIKFRRDWGPLKPVTKVKPSDKLYDRNKEKNIKDA